MESSIAKRDKIGVQDFVLLEDFRSETAFVENLRKRYNENLIYVSVEMPSRCIITARFRRTLEAFLYQLIHTRPSRACMVMIRCQSIVE